MVDRSPHCYSNLLTFFILFTSSFLLSPSNAAVHDSTSLDGLTNGDRWWMEKFGGDNISLVLAGRRTYRRDPTDGFKRYSGGWNISNPHYWASVGFTAVPFYAIAAAWFVIFGLTLVCTCFYFCCCRSPPSGYSRTCYACSLIFLTLFTITAITGSFFLYIGQGKFNSTTTNTLDYVVAQANAIGNNLTHVSSYLDTVKKIGVDKLTLPKIIQTQISKVHKLTDSVATILTSKAQYNARRIHNVLNKVRIALIIIAAFMLVLAFIGFLFSVCGLQGLVYTLVILGWIMVTGTFILCGVFLLLHNVVGDTCVAMNEWVEHPTAHTALDDIMPCIDPALAHYIFKASKHTNRHFVTLLDTMIGNMSNADYPPDNPLLYYNQSGPLLPLLCNPYNSDLSPRTCSPREVNYSSAKEVWKKYVCKVSADGSICITKGRLTPKYYGQFVNLANLSYGLYTYAPFLHDVGTCTVERNTFDYIGKTYCPELHKYTWWVYVGLLMVSAGVMLSLIFWVVYARERRHRVYTKHINGSARIANSG